LVVGMDHDPDLHDPSDGGREEEWAGHQQMEVERRSGRGISRWRERGGVGGASADGGREEEWVVFFTCSAD